MSDYSVLSIPVTGYSDLGRDVAKWAIALPRDFDIIVGVPRSGLLPATMLALHLNLPMTSLDIFLSERRILETGKRGHLKQHKATQTPPQTMKRPIKVLVVDDCVATGSSMEKARASLSANQDYDISFGTLYCQKDHVDLVDFFYEEREVCYLFEWNVMHLSRFMARACVAMDGVLCDFDTTPSVMRSHKAVASARPMFTPTVRIKTVLACRPSHWRSVTEAWLASYGIEWEELLMLPSTPDPLTVKAEAYKQSGANVFIEATRTNAWSISARTGLPAYSLEGPYFFVPSSTGPNGLISFQKSLIFSSR